MIKILDTHTINKIAAGEVVERPSSVVKELVENSIDAGSSSVTVEIKNGGIDLIRVTDNGVGIPKDEVETAFLRHATSKISAAEDLYEVVSLGFRGEALASIAAVSHVELITKVEKDLTGKRIEISGGKITSSEEIACPNGTTFLMRHLFYNVPARKAFLSSSGTESARIADYMYKLALAHPEIAFKYIQNGKTVFSTSGDHELTHAVLNIYGKEYAKNTLKCYYEDKGIECVGLLGKPTLNRGNRNYEHFFINGRYIKSAILQKAVEDAYKPFLMVGKFPFVILHLHIDPSMVDVNVHPTKLQVRFRDIDLISNTVYEAVRSHLQAQTMIPDVALEKPRGQVVPKPVVEQIGVDTFFAPRKEDNKATPATMLKEEKVSSESYITQSWQKLMPPMVHSSLKCEKSDPKAPVEHLFGSVQKTTYETPKVEKPQVTEDFLPVGEMPLIGEAPAKTFINEENAIPIKQAESTQPLNKESIPYLTQKVEALPKPTAPSILPSDYRIVGQLFKTYWLIQYHEKVFIIDQHSAHERVLYEKFLAHFREGQVATQMLLIPETFNLTPIELELVGKNQQLFQKIGFVFEVFGEKSIVVREVPYILNEPLSPSVFQDILDTLSHDSPKDITDLKAESIIRLSCRSAVKAHDQISEEECHKLIELLLSLDNPFTCPHGRPTLVSLTQTDIEKMFKRIQ